MNNIDEIIKKLSQSDYTFGNGELTPAEVRQIKQGVIPSTLSEFLGLAENSPE